MTEETYTMEAKIPTKNFLSTNEEVFSNFDAYEADEPTAQLALKASDVLIGAVLILKRIIAEGAEEEIVDLVRQAIEMAEKGDS